MDGYEVMLVISHIVIMVMGFLVGRIHGMNDMADFVKDVIREGEEWEDKV